MGTAEQSMTQSIRGSLSPILTYVGFTLTLFAFLTVLGVFVLRVKKPGIKRPFKMWGYPVTPAFYLVLNGWMLCYLLIQRPFPSAIGLLTVGSALLLYSMLARPTNITSERDVFK